LKAVEHVEKVRVNPGNFADKKKFALREYSEAEYAAELARIHEVFSPLVRRAKELGVDLYLGKPFQEEELLRHLREMLALTP